MLPNLRIVPVTIVAVTLLLGVKTTEIWRDAEWHIVASADAAEEKAEKKKAANADVATASAPVMLDPAPKPDAAGYSPAEAELLQGLSQRRQALEARSAELDLREKLLAVTEQRIDERVAELRKLEANLKLLAKQKDEEEERNLRSLVKVYENMKAKDAARILENLDALVLIDVVERMKEAKLAPVLAEMDPAKAQKLTVELATRRSSGAKQPGKG